MRQILTINNKPLSDFNCFYDGSEWFRKPERMVEMYSVVGKNGDLAVSDGRYSNISIPFRCYIRENFKDNFSNLLDYLAENEDNYVRVESNEQPDVYRLGLFSSEIQPSMWQFNRNGTFTLELNFKPQKWLKMGEIGIELESSQTILNPTSFAALPLFEVVGTGTLNVNSSVLVLANNTSTTMIDCEMQDCYEGVINRNPDLTITGGFPSLKKGENVISFTGFSSVKLIPRWWKL